ncbi:MAG: hypothetical protein AB1401_12005 [Thermodesulfobacteriota bacterium]
MKLNQRFDIEIGLDEAKRRFVNRVYNKVFYNFFLGISDSERYRIHREIVSALGDKFPDYKNLAEQIGDDFYRNLQALETFYQTSGGYRSTVDQLIKLILSESEVDLGVQWTNGRFIKSGAELLDEKLVDDSLHWLREKKYSSVIKPFEKGLDHLLHSEKRPELLSDVITDMYEALEALSKIITERSNKDLSANRELFISKVNASNEYKKILLEYITYANEFRHAQEEGMSKPAISPREAESFVYLTGLFIRLAIQ